ncbi:MAG TPA: asparagine synthase (glutamine-hydrolyzing) [Bacteroidota bacterium]|nr:asparagine synthase (glutamine-hydrolyzing) [Bacteroidota bacterium]
MCGITGIFDSGGVIDRGELVRFTDMLSHRGPDGGEVDLCGNVGLGHRRLAILDLTESGKNPMEYTSPGGDLYRITFNGEIYNFIELRRELESLGHRFRSRSDTEVVLASYAEWGKNCLVRFNGMWAFGIWDSTRRELFLARDRFGVKPLYYHRNGRLTFASELKAFTALDRFQVVMNEPLVHRIMQASEPWEGTTDETMVAGIRSLPAGHCMTVGADGRPEVVRWWESRDHIPGIPGRYEEQVDQFRELFLDAVRIRMRSDVPVGTSLSGGVDSSAVATAMAWLHRDSRSDLERCPSDWQKAFVALFPGSSLDEKRFADIAAREAGVHVHYREFDPVEAVRTLQDAVWAVEYVHGVLASPVWAIYREMRRNNVLVSIDGHGADELLGGYAGYLDVPVREINDRLYSDVHRTMLPSILRNYDRCSMAHGVEVRMPLLDWRLVTFALGLPPSSKMGGGYTKRVLRDALRGILPEAIRTRRSKIGFNAPLIEWFNGPMSGVVDRLIGHPFWNDNPFWDGKNMARLIRERAQAGPWRYGDWGEVVQLSIMVNLLLWHSLFVERKRLELS